MLRYAKTEINMKLKHFFLSIISVVAVSLTACSSDNDSFLPDAEDIETPDSPQTGTEDVTVPASQSAATTVSSSESTYFL